MSKDAVILHVIVFNNEVITLNDFLLELRKINVFTLDENFKKETNFEYEIPICYDYKYGKDLKFLSTKLKLEVEEIIQLHLRKKYKVLMMGFLAGLPFLGNLTKKGVSIIIVLPDLRGFSRFNFTTSIQSG